MSDVNQQRGFVSGAMVASVVLGLLVLVFGSIMIWALINYNDQKNNADSKREIAMRDAADTQKTKDQKDFEEQEKNPLKEFVGPTDLGRVNFKYPKTWSVYVANDGSTGGVYEAYLHPEQVPPTTGNINRFALHVSVVSQNYDQVLQQYVGLVKSGKLRSSAITASGFNGTRLDGNFTATVEGSAAIFKIRDKTLILKTDSPTFRPDFNDKILQTLTFIQ